MFPDESIVPEQYENSFIRGVFDGDGSIYAAGASCGVSITGNLSLMSSVLERFSRVTGTKSKVYKDHSAFSIRIGGRKNVEKIYDYLYKNAECFLERKKHRFDELLRKEDGCSETIIGEP